MPDDQAAEIFAFWREILSNPRARMDDRRRRLINARLADGYSVEDLQLAILGCRASSWHMGDNDRGTRYCTIDLICRSAEKIDQFRELAEAEASKISRRTIEAAKDDAPRTSMPDSVRAKLQLLLGRFNPQSSQAADTRSTAKAPPEAA